MSVRNPQKYHVNKANTKRYRKSTIPYLQRLLNKDSLKRKSEFNQMLTFNDCKRRKRG